MFWRPATHAPDVVFTDTDVGRYSIRCASKGAPDHRLLLDGKFTGYRGSVDELKSIVEWIIAGRIITNLAKEGRPAPGNAEAARRRAARTRRQD